jgi:hypothetical protein
VLITMPSFSVEMGITNFLPKLASNHNHPDLAPASITGISHQQLVFMKQFLYLIRYGNMFI